MPARIEERPEVALWTKLVANASLNTVTALGRANVGAGVLADRAAVELMLALGREVVAVAHALDVPGPDDAAEAYVADARRRLPRDGGSSTLFDLVAGQPLESAALVGAVVAGGGAAARAGAGEPRLRRPPGPLGSCPPLGSH